MTAEQALAHVRALVERNRQGRSADPGSVPPPPVRSLGICGAGLMGTAIAAAAIRHGVSVTMTDADEAALAVAAERTLAELTAPETEPVAAPQQRVADLLRSTPDLVAVGRCELVLESIVEDKSVKRRLYDQLAPHLETNTILATNTSTIPIGELAEGLPDPPRFCGIHFFHPVRLRPLVEVVRGPQSGDETVATAVGFAKAIGKMAIVVDDGPGFLVNRLLLPYLNEALELLLDGASVESVEGAATAFGMPMGPLTVYDEIGLDTAILGGRVLWEAFPERIDASPLLVSLVKAGRLGRKSGAGFYAYDSPTSPPRRDPKLDELIARWARDPQPLDYQTITARLFLPMVLEAVRIFEEGRVTDPGDIDLGVLYGLGFPEHRGGLLYWADTLGPARLLEMLEPLAPLGPRAQPPKLLVEMARTARRFYDVAES